MNKISILLITGLLTITSFTNLNAQNCSNDKVSIFVNYVKGEFYEEATPLLAELRKNCKSWDSNIYIYGERMYRAKLKSATDKKAIANELIQLLYDRLSYVPRGITKGYVFGKIGLLMIDYEIGNTKEQYDVFDEAFKTDLKNFNNPKQLYLYFELYYNMYNSENQGIELEDLNEKFKEVNKKFKSESERLVILKNKIIDKINTGQKLSQREKMRERFTDGSIKLIVIFTKKMKSLLDK